MNIIKQSWEFFSERPNGKNILEKIERSGRICYQSEPKGDSGKFVEMIIKRGHESVLEHESVSVKLITDRGVTHELVRHRLAAYSQESTRYCNYSANKFSGAISIILPVRFYEIFKDIEWPASLITHPESARFTNWHDGVLAAEGRYLHALELGDTPQEARDLLPNSLKTEIVMTANLREWRHVFRLRTSKAAHPQMRHLMLQVLEGFKKEIPVIFDDLCQ